MREYYGFALVAGIPYTEARHMEPGFIRDMYMIRFKYDAQLMGAKIGKKLGM